MRPRARAELGIAVAVLSIAGALVASASHFHYARWAEVDLTEAMLIEEGNVLRLALEPFPEGDAALVAKIAKLTQANVRLLDGKGAPIDDKGPHPSFSRPTFFEEEKELLHVPTLFGAGDHEIAICLERVVPRPDLGPSRLIAIAMSVLTAFATAAVASVFMGRSVSPLVTKVRRVAARDRSASVVLPAGEVDAVGLHEELDRRIDDLARERDQLEVALEALEEGVIALDGEQRITLVNRAGRQLLGLPERPSGVRMFDVVQSGVLRSLVGAAAAGEPGSVELELQQNGTPTRLFAVAKSLERANVALVVRDVTQMHRLQRIRRDFVANVSHELRTPISIILANAETLIGGAMDDPKASATFLDAIQRNAERLSRLVSDLLDLSRLESGRFSLQLAELEAEEMIRGVARELRPAATEKGVTLIDPTEGHHVVRADRHAVEQILVNLLENAIKYGREQGRVEVRVIDKSETILIEVEDDGPGIDAKHRPRLFERFYRVDKGRARDSGGTGLGLSIVKHLAEVMGGACGMRPAEQHGSVFWFTLRKVR